MYINILSTCSNILTLISTCIYDIIKKRGEKMETEARKKARRNYREAHATISITKEIKEVMDKAAEASGKSKAQYIVDLIKKDNNIL